jgi:hypothetical protein
MSGPNEPRLMKPRHPDDKPVFSNASGDAARDGYTRIAGRKHPEDREEPKDGAYPMIYDGGSGQITPEVGERDYSRGPRFHEDY